MVHKLMVVSIAVALAFGVVGVTTAQETRYSVAIAPGQQERGARLGAPEMRMTLQDAVAMALAHNINLEVSRLGLASAQEGIIASTGIFDPTLGANAGISDTETASTSAISSSSKGQNFGLSLAKLFATGTSATVAWTNRRTEYSDLSGISSNIFSTNPSYSSGFSFNLSQPLLQGFGMRVNRIGIEIAQKNREITRLQFEQLVISNIQQVEAAYWNLVYWRDNLAVKQQSLKLAQDLLDQTKTRVRIGTSAPIDIIQSEATVAAREQDIILAVNQVQGAIDDLKELLGFERPEDWKAQIVPVDSLESQTEKADLDQAIETALRDRLDLKLSQLDRDIRAANLVVAQDAAKPSLDLNLGYGYNGAAGTHYVLDESGNKVRVVEGWSDVWSQLTDRQYPQWSASVVLSYPLGNHSAKARLVQRRYDVETGKQNFALATQGVIAGVRAAVRNLDASAQSIAAAAKARELAEKNLDAEQKKFANGMSTNYQVLMIQEALATAQAAELQAQVAYRLSKSSYQVSIGALLQSVGVAIKE